jgi:hypothetical protein
MSVGIATLPLTQSTQIYSSLCHSDSIRFLILETGERGSMISCRLQETRLRASPVYEALSYVAPIYLGKIGKALELA